MAFNIPRGNPRLIDTQFADVYPALGLRATVNSGALNGDGDMQPAVINYERPLFAVESKVRYTSHSVMPKPGEIRKAIQQLKTKTRQAICMMLIHAQPSRQFSVSLSAREMRLLTGWFDVTSAPLPAPSDHFVLPRRGLVGEPWVLYNEPEWDALYDRIAAEFPL